VAVMSQSEIDALRAAMQACFNPPVGAEGLDTMVVPIRVQFNPDGSLATDPIAQATPPGPVGQALADAALRAVRRCAPYPFLPPEKYDSWETVTVNFSPPPMF
jgi:outer membrane biosynthesis protein TonB